MGIYQLLALGTRLKAHFVLGYLMHSIYAQ